MGTIECPLATGLTIGDKPIKTLIIREGTVNDTLNALEGNPDTAPLALSRAILAERVVKYGDIDGPMTSDLMGRLTEADFDALDEKVSIWDQQLAQKSRELMGLPEKR